MMRTWCNEARKVSRVLNQICHLFIDGPNNQRNVKTQTYWIPYYYFSAKRRLLSTADMDIFCFYVSIKCWAQVWTWFVCEAYWRNLFIVLDCYLTLSKHNHRSSSGPDDAEALVSIPSATSKCDDMVTPNSSNEQETMKYLILDRFYAVDKHMTTC